MVDQARYAQLLATTETLELVKTVALQGIMQFFHGMQMLINITTYLPT